MSILVPKPTAAQLAAGVHKTLRDVIAPDLRVLFCGINPGLYSGATGHHFARPGNRFWPALHAGGFTPRLFSPSDEHELLGLGIGITNVVARTTTAASELRPEEYIAGAKLLVTKVKRYRPKVLAILGVGAYRAAFVKREATFGPQAELIGATRVWVLPNPSGLNAHYTPKELGRLFEEMSRALAADI